MDDEVARLTALKNDDALSSMKKAKASNELAQLQSREPLPLNRARITPDAAVRKLKKAQKKADRTAAEAAAEREVSAAAAGKSQEAAQAG